MFSLPFLLGLLRLASAGIVLAAIVQLDLIYEHLHLHLNISHRGLLLLLLLHGLAMHHLTALLPQPLVCPWPVQLRADVVGVPMQI